MVMFTVALAGGVFPVWLASKQASMQAGTGVDVRRLPSAVVRIEEHHTLGLNGDAVCAHH